MPRKGLALLVSAMPRRGRTSTGRPSLVGASPGRRTAAQGPPTASRLSARVASPNTATRQAPPNYISSLNRPPQPSEFRSTVRALLVARFNQFERI